MSCHYDIATLICEEPRPTAKNIRIGEVACAMSNRVANAVVSTEHLTKGFAMPISLIVGVVSLLIVSCLGAVLNGHLDADSSTFEMTTVALLPIVCGMSLLPLAHAIDQVVLRAHNVITTDTNKHTQKLPN